MTGTSGWSWRLRPTPGRSARTVDAEASEIACVRDARQREDPRRLEGAGAQHDLLGGAHLLDQPVARDLDADAAIALEQQPQRARAREDGEAGMPGDRREERASRCCRAARRGW